MPRNHFTLSSKIALLDKTKSQPLNISHHSLVDITGVPKSTIALLLQQENQLCEEWSLHKEIPETSKRKSDGKDPEVEEALDQWFYTVTRQGVNILATQC